MPSQFSTDLRIELIGNGEQSGTWGTTTNNNLGTLIEDAISGMAAVSVTSAAQPLTAIDGAADEARCAALRLTTTTGAAFAVYAPPVTKLYVIQNTTSFTATIYASTVIGNTTAAGTGVAIPAGKTMLVRCQPRLGSPSNFDFVDAISYITSLEAGDTVLGNRLSATYTQTATTVTVTTSVVHEYVNGESVSFINSTGDGVSGTYTITYINTTSFSFTSPVSQSTSGNCFVTNDAVTISGVVGPAVVIEGGSTIPALRVSQSSTGVGLAVTQSSTGTSLYVSQTGSGAPVVVENRFIITNGGEVIIGSGEASSITSGNTLRGPNRTGADVTGANLAIQAGNGTGTGGSGTIALRTAGTGSSGSSANSMQDRFLVNNSGEIIIGSGEATSTTSGNTLRGPNRTGTNAAGADLTIQSGNGTGTGGSGFIALQTAVPGSSGSSANTMVDRLKLSNGVMVGKSFDMNYGVIPVAQYYALNSDSAGANNTSAQALFGVGVNLAANTIYEFEMQFVLFKSAGTTSHTISLLHNIGSGTINNINYSLMAGFQANPVTALNPPLYFAYFQTAAASVVSAATTTAGANYRAIVKGTISVGTAGKWTPQYQLSAAPGGAYSTLTGSFVKIYPVGASGANVNSGGWSA